MEKDFYYHHVELFTPKPLKHHNTFQERDIFADEKVQKACKRAVIESLRGTLKRAKRSPLSQILTEAAAAAGSHVRAERGRGVTVASYEHMQCRFKTNNPYESAERIFRVSNEEVLALCDRVRQVVLKKSQS